MAREPKQMVGVKVPPAVKLQLEQMAYDRRTTVSAMVRSWIDEKLDQEL